MKKVVLYISIVFGNCTSSSSQTYFNERYDFSGGSEVGFSILTKDSGYIVSGGTSPGNSIGIMELDNEGNVIVQKNLTKSGTSYYAGYAGSLNHTFDGGYVLGGGVSDNQGADIFLVKYNSLLDTLWTSRIGDTLFETGRYAIQTKDSGYAVVGQADVGTHNQVILVKTDKNGNVEWQKYYGGTGADGVVNVEQTFDGGYILGCMRQFSSYDTWIIKTDSLGNIKWTKQYGGNEDDCIGFVNELTDSSYIIGTCEAINNGQSKGWVIKISKSGGEEWQKKYGDINEVGVFGKATELPDGGFILHKTGFTNNGIPIVGELLKISPTGDSLWMRSYQKLLAPNSDNYFNDLTLTDDGGFAIVGFVNPSSSDTGTQDMWVIKLDSMGCAEPGCDTLLSQKSKVESQKETIKVYPNPSRGTFTVQSNQQGTFTITDLTGRQVATGKLNKEFTLHQPNGIYLIRVGTTVSKLVLEQ